MLLSIQALVLCEQPYYNEAGYEKQLGTSEGAHHARRYNEGALLLSLKSMMTTLKHLSSPFEQLTTDIIEVNINPIRAGLIDGTFDMTSFVINCSIVTDFIFEPATFFFATSKAYYTPSTHCFRDLTRSVTYRSTSG